eukprot:SAG31_NODE_44591_length_262_cov_0.638037_1_plen_57_part_01
MDFNVSGQQVGVHRLLSRDTASSRHRKVYAGGNLRSTQGPPPQRAGSQAAAKQQAAQ